MKQHLLGMGTGSGCQRLGSVPIPAFCIKSRGQGRLAMSVLVRPVSNHAVDSELVNAVEDLGMIG
jgi:hypothetical protein